MNPFEATANADRTEEERISRDWEYEQRSEADYRDREVNFGLDDEARRSIWDEYQERFNRENYLDLAEFRKPCDIARMQMDLFGEVA